ncbi:hypothetical protein ACCO45_003321 [Purpureocillium lilacinum]|uniref:Uncharacterized protein n=1 Tax=Purpureocillium lilacinum TaxID=33203 RepID=A0ACC4E0I4_PURLI
MGHGGALGPHVVYGVSLPLRKSSVLDTLFAVQLAWPSSLTRVYRHPGPSPASPSCRWPAASSRTSTATATKPLPVRRSPPRDNMGTRRGRRPAAHRAPLRGPRPRAPPTRHQRALHPRHAAGRPLAQHRRARRRAGPHRSGRLVQRAVSAHRGRRVPARAARPRPQRLHVRDAAGRHLGAGVWRRRGGGDADAGRLARCAVGESRAGDAMRGAGAGVLSRDVRGCDSAAEGGGTQTWGRAKALLPGPSSVGETSLGTKEEGSAAGFHVSSITRPFAVLFGSGVLASLAVFGSVIFSYFYVVSVTLPTILDEIYGLSPAAIGSSFLANGIGSLIGIAICNLSLDRIYVKLKTKNDGVGLPEYRLPLAIVGAFILPPGVALYGSCAEYRLPLWLLYASVVWVRMALILVFLPLMAYVVDAYGIYSASAMTGVIVVRCLAGAFLPVVTVLVIQDLGYGWGSRRSVRCVLSWASSRW